MDLEQQARTGTIYSIKGFYFPIAMKVEIQ